MNKPIYGNTVGGGGGSKPVPQADWNQTDETQADFIKNKPIDEINNIKDAVNDCEDEVSSIRDTVSDYEKRLINLEHQFAPSFFKIDDSISYSKDIPENACPYAQISYIGGMTYKTTNLLYGDKLKSGYTEEVNGITYSVNEDGCVVLNGTSTADTRFKIVEMFGLRGGVDYTISSGLSAGTGTSTYQMWIQRTDGEDILDIDTGTTFRLDKATSITVNFSVYANVTVNNLVIRPMLNEGKVAQPYSAHFDGLRNVGVSALKKRGKNLYDYVDIFDDFPKTHVSVNDGIVDVKDSSGLFQKFANCYIPSGYIVSCTPIQKDNMASGARLRFVAEDGTFLQVFITDGNAALQQNTLLLTKNIVKIGFNWTAFNNGFSFKDLQIEKGPGATEYSPYFEETLEIPIGIQNTPGYNEGINANYYNYIDFENNKFVKYVESIKLADLNWEVLSDGLYSTSDLQDKIIKDENIIQCDMYDVGSYEGIYNGTINIGIASKDGNVIIRNSNYTDLAGFCNSLKDTKLIYGLAEPEEIDVAGLPTENGFIEVEEKGLFTAINEYSYGAPSKITYMLKGDN